MADGNSTPAFVGGLLSLTTDDRLLVLRMTHPLYQANVESWNVLIDAFEGQGGFLNGEYLWPFSRESEGDFQRRQKTARYHNYLEALIDLYVRFIWTQGVQRSSKSEEYNNWLTDVDGSGTKVDELLKRLAALSLVSGHAGLLIDKTGETPLGPRKIDERARVVASIFTSPAIGDWRHDGDTMTGVKLFESATQTDIAKPLLTGEDARQYLLWDEEGWARFDSKGELVDSAITNLGLVPLSILRPKPSQLGLVIGRPLVGNANVIRALYNRNSEEDVVLRDQAFSVMTVKVPPEASVDETRTQIGNVIGTAKALITKGDINYVTPSQEVPGTIRDNAAFLIQEMYRAAHVRYKRDSLAAESGEAVRLQYTELNEMLQGFSKSLGQVEQEMARDFFAWTSTTEDQAQSAFDKAQVESTYPQEFFLDELMTDLEAWAQGLEMGLGTTMNKRIKKHAVRRIDPQIPPEELETIDAEIDAQSDEESGMPSATTSTATPVATDTGDPEGDAIKKAQQSDAEVNDNAA